MKKIKEIKPSYIVNLDEIEHLDDIAAVFALSKHSAGLPLTDGELLDIIDYATDMMRPTIIVCNCTKEKKLPWYKRFWNSLKKPFIKKK